MSVGPLTRCVKDLVSDYSVGELRDPDYQREYVWSDKQAENFLQRTLGLGHVLGVVTTYSIQSGSASFLQDGKQRITTLQKAIERPARYGLEKEHADRLKASYVFQQKMVYESHDEARLDFQHLNTSTGLIPFEKYRGDLESDESGKLLYQRVRTTTDGLTIELAGKSRTSSHGRKRAGQLSRNSLGLFYQYATDSKTIELYAKSERSLNNQIERIVRKWLNENQDTWPNVVDLFVKDLERINVLLKEKTRSTPKQWDITAVRAMYGARFHIRNIDCNFDVFEQLVDWYVASNLSRKTWPSRFEVLFDQVPMPVRLDQSSLKWLYRIGNIGGPAISPARRNKKFVAPAGYDESHVVPHADGGGDGTTFAEPSIINRSRGRAPVSLEQ